MTMTILNFSDSYIYQIDLNKVSIWDPLWTSEDYEQYLMDIEFKLSNIEWMVGKNNEIINMN
jgi:hypothetical protein